MDCPIRLIECSVSFTHPSVRNPVPHVVMTLENDTVIRYDKTEYDSKMYLTCTTGIICDSIVNGIDCRGGAFLSGDHCCASSDCTHRVCINCGMLICGHCNIWRHSCPRCKKDCWIDDDKIPSDYVNVVDKKRVLLLDKIRICEECDKDIATVSCHMCDVVMCTDCTHYFYGTGDNPHCRECHSCCYR